MKTLILAAIAATVLASAASVQASERFDAAKFFEDLATRTGQ
jgi:hypothetical protein